MNGAAGESGPLADSNQSERERIALFLGRDAASVVTNLEQQFFAALPQTQLDARRVGVTRNVRQRLLHDAVDGGDGGTFQMQLRFLRKRELALDSGPLLEPGRFGFD